MILVDTSVWIHHFRSGNARLRTLLESGEAATHPMVLGELACGNMSNRAETLHLLSCLPGVPQAPDWIVMQAIETRHLWSKGIGWIDAHLLVASITAAVRLWTLDQRLAKLVD